MTLRSAYLYLFLVAPFVVSAQSAGKIRLLVDPGHNFKFVVDKQFKMEQREVELSALLLPEDRPRAIGQRNDCFQGFLPWLPGSLA